MAWNAKTEVVLLITPDSGLAKKYMDSVADREGRIYAWAPRFSSVVARNPKTTWYAGLGDFYMDPEADRAYWYCKDRGYRYLHTFV